MSAIIIMKCGDWGSSELSWPSALYHVPSTQTIILRVVVGTDIFAKRLECALREVG